MSEYRTYLVEAERFARLAGAILLEAYGRVSFREKAPGDLVTDADRASQDRVSTEIRQRFPDHTLLAEEDGIQPDPSREWRWIVDPLDGTINFAHQFPLWCVSIGLEYQGSMVVGAVYVPLTDTMYSAARGLGFRVNGELRRVSQARTLRESLITTGIPVGFAQDAQRQLALFGRFSTGTHSVRRTGSTAWNLAQLAAGACDVCYSTLVYPWDVAAGGLLIEEAGGRVTSFDGRGYSVYQPTILATNGHVHEEALEAVREALAHA